MQVFNILPIFSPNTYNRLIITQLGNSQLQAIQKMPFINALRWKKKTKQQTNKKNQPLLLALVLKLLWARIYIYIYIYISHRCMNHVLGLHDIALLIFIISSWSTIHLKTKYMIGHMIKNVTFVEYISLMGKQKKIYLLQKPYRKDNC